MPEPSPSIEAVLARCIDLIQQGQVTHADCLARYPEHREELCFSIKVSNRAIRLLRPNPVKKAFDLLDRVEPSITKTFRIGKFTKLAYLKIASLSSPDSSGVNLLNRGIIQVGATYCKINDNTAATAQQ